MYNKDQHALGIPLTIIGNGWEKSQQHAEHSYLPSESFMDLIKRIKQSQFVLHNSPGFKQGLHERVTYSLLNGTMVLTEENAYLQSEFGGGKGIFFYKSLEEMSDLHNLISKEQYTSSISNGRQQIENNHIWSHRLSTLQF